MRRLLAAISLALLMLVPVSASAASKDCASNPNPLACACATNGASSSSACDSSVNGGDPIAGPNGVLKKATILLSIIAGAVAVIIVLVGGIQYTTSAGDAQKATNARNTIIGGLVGLAIIAVSGGILTFVISKV